ncbi:MAG TPA: hypothetical protein VND19_06355 [Acetobacteraceae bacterium]|nr:hypothetical protein [Acetobacteraceae bacterium]
MTVAYFAVFRHDGAVGTEELHGLARLPAATPDLARGLIYTPARAHDPNLDDGRPPALALPLYFPAIAALEAAVARDGHLQALSGVHRQGHAFSDEHKYGSRPAPLRSVEPRSRSVRQGRNVSQPAAARVSVATHGCLCATPLSRVALLRDLSQFAGEASL